MSVRVEVHRADDRGNVYTLLEDLRWGELTVPAGFESDGASVPRFFWRLVFPPGDAAALRAAILHDYVYREQPEGWNRADADKLFYGVLLGDGVSAWRARLAYWGVRLFGGRSWDDE